MKAQYKPIRNAVIGFMVAVVLYLVGNWAYYRFAPPKWFLNYYSVHVSNASVDEDVPFTVCRQKRYPNLYIGASRTFFLITEDEKDTPVGEYKFDAIIEEGTECQNIHISKDVHPQKPGTYYAHTEAEFWVNGHRKVISYDTNYYEIDDTQESLERRIEQLERELAKLKLRLEEFKARATLKEAQCLEECEEQSETNQAQPQPTSRTEPTSPGETPPQPPNTPQPDDRNVLERARDAVEGLVNEVLGL